MASAGHVSEVRLLADGSAWARQAARQVESQGEAAPSEAVRPEGLSNEELVDLRQLSRSLLGSWAEPGERARALQRYWPVPGDPQAPTPLIRPGRAREHEPSASAAAGLAVPRPSKRPRRAASTASTAPASTASASGASYPARAGAQLSGVVGQQPLPSVPGVPDGAVRLVASSIPRRRCGICSTCASSGAACPALAAVHRWDRQLGSVPRAVLCTLAEDVRRGTRCTRARCGLCYNCQLSSKGSPCLSNAATADGRVPGRRADTAAGAHAGGNAEVAAEEQEGQEEDEGSLFAPEAVVPVPSVPGVPHAAVLRAGFERGKRRPCGLCEACSRRPRVPADCCVLRALRDWDKLLPSVPLRLLRRLEGALPGRRSRCGLCRLCARPGCNFRGSAQCLAWSAVLFQPGALDRLASDREQARRQAPTEVLATTAAAVQLRLQEIWRDGIARGDAEDGDGEDASGDDGAVGSAFEPASASRQLQQAAATSGSASEAGSGSSAALGSDEEGRWAGWLPHFFPCDNDGSSDNETKSDANADQEALIAGINLGGKKWYCYSRWVPPISEDGSPEVCGKRNRKDAPTCGQCGAVRWDGPDGQLRSRVWAAAQAAALGYDSDNVEGQLAARLRWEGGTLPQLLPRFETAEELADLGREFGGLVRLLERRHPAAQPAGAGSRHVRRRARLRAVQRSALAASVRQLETAAARLAEDQLALRALAGPAPVPTRSAAAEAAAGSGPVLASQGARRDQATAAEGPAAYGEFACALGELLEETGVPEGVGRSALEHRCDALFCAPPAGEGGALLPVLEKLRSVHRAASAADSGVEAAGELRQAGPLADLCWLPGTQLSQVASGPPPAAMQRSQLADPERAPLAHPAARPAEPEQLQRISPPPAATDKEGLRQRQLEGVASGTLRFAWALLGETLARALLPEPELEGKGGKKRSAHGRAPARSAAMLLPPLPRSLAASSAHWFQERAPPLEGAPGSSRGDGADASRRPGWRSPKSSSPPLVLSEAAPGGLSGSMLRELLGSDAPAPRRRDQPRVEPLAAPQQHAPPQAGGHPSAFEIAAAPEPEGGGPKPLLRGGQDQSGGEDPGSGRLPQALHGLPREVRAVFEVALEVGAAEPVVLRALRAYRSATAAGERDLQHRAAQQPPARGASTRTRGAPRGGYHHSRQL